MIVFFYGSDTAQSRLALRSAIEKFKKERDPFGYNVSRFVSGECSQKIVAENAVSVPFLAEKRLVVLEGVCGSGDDLLIAWVRSALHPDFLPETTTLILWEGGGKTKGTGSKSLFDALKKERFARCFDMPDERDLPTYVRKKAEAYGFSFSSSAAVNFASRFAGDSWGIESSILMLQSFIFPRKTVEVVDIDILFGSFAEDQLFLCVEQVCRGESVVAEKTLLAQERLGADPQMLLPLFAKQLRGIYAAALSDKSSSGEIARVLGIHPFAAEKASSLGKRIGAERAKKVHDALLCAYRAARSGVNPWVALRSFVYT